MKKNLYLVQLTTVFSSLCIVVNMADDINILGRIMLLGRTRKQLVKPANISPEILR